MIDIASLNNNLPTYFEALDDTNEPTTTQNVIGEQTLLANNNNNVVLQTIPNSIPSIIQQQPYIPSSTVLQSSENYHNTAPVIPPNNQIFTTNYNVTNLQNQINSAELLPQQTQQQQPSPSPYTNNTIVSPLNNITVASSPQYVVVNQNLTPQTNTFISFPNGSPQNIGLNSSLNTISTSSPLPSNNSMINSIYQGQATNSVMISNGMIRQSPVNHAYSAPVFSNTLSPPSLPTQENNTNLPLNISSAGIANTISSNSNTPILSTRSGINSANTTPIISNPMTPGLISSSMGTPIISRGSVSNILSSDITTPLVMNASIPMLTNDLSSPITPMQGSTSIIPTGLFNINGPTTNETVIRNGSLVIPSDTTSSTPISNSVVINTPHMASIDSLSPPNKANSIFTINQKSYSFSNGINGSGSDINIHPNNTPVTVSKGILDGLTPPTKSKSISYDDVPLLNVGSTPSHNPKEFLNSLPTPTDSFTMKCSMNKDGIKLDNKSEPSLQNLSIAKPAGVMMPISPKEELSKITGKQPMIIQTSTPTSSNISYPSPQAINKKVVSNNSISSSSTTANATTQILQKQMLTEEPGSFLNEISHPNTSGSILHNNIHNSNVHNNNSNNQTTITHAESIANLQKMNIPNSIPTSMPTPVTSPMSRPFSSQAMSNSLQETINLSQTLPLKINDGSSDNKNKMASSTNANINIPSNTTLSNINLNTFKEYLRKRVISNKPSYAKKSMPVALSSPLTSVIINTLRAKSSDLKSSPMGPIRSMSSMGDSTVFNKPKSSDLKNTPMKTPMNPKTDPLKFSEPVSGKEALNLTDPGLFVDPLKDSRLVKPEIAKEIQNKTTSLNEESLKPKTVIKNGKPKGLTFTDLLKEATIQNKSLTFNDLISDNVVASGSNIKNKSQIFTEPLPFTSPLDGAEIKEEEDILTLDDLLNEASIQHKNVTFNDLLTENNVSIPILLSKKETKPLEKEVSETKVLSQENIIQPLNKLSDDSTITIKKEITSQIEKAKSLIDEKLLKYNNNNNNNNNVIAQKAPESEQKKKDVKNNKIKMNDTLKEIEQEKEKITKALRKENSSQKLENEKAMKKRKEFSNDDENDEMSIPSKKQKIVKEKAVTKKEKAEDGTNCSTEDNNSTVSSTSASTSSKASKRKSNEEGAKEDETSNKKKKINKDSTEPKKKRSKENKSKIVTENGIIAKVKYNSNNISLYDSEIKALLKYQTKDNEDIYPLRCICEGDYDEKEITLGLEELVCSYPNCNKIFDKSIHLEKHFIEHGEDFRPFQCPNCTKNFRRRYDLMRHIRIHNYIIPYRCSRCLRGFTRSDSCARHTKTKQCKYYDFDTIGMKKEQPPYYTIVKDPEQKTEKEIVIIPLNKSS